LVPLLSRVPAEDPVRDGGVISRVPQYTQGPMGADILMRNITLTGGVAPARAYIEELLPDVLDDATEPGKLFDTTFVLADAPSGYRAMAERQVLKALIALGPSMRSTAPICDCVDIAPLTSHVIRNND
jgi:threonine dehydrogenase-like Zn-dependent dehydrogenase